MEEARNGLLAALRIGDGHLVWQRRTVGGSIGALAPARDLLLAPAEGVTGGILAFRHDASAALEDGLSPTQLLLPAALLNYLLAFVAVVAGILALGRFVLRTPPTELPLDAPPPDEDEA
jgi:hypothetical protein